MLATALAFWLSSIEQSTEQSLEQFDEGESVRHFFLYVRMGEQSLLSITGYWQQGGKLRPNRDNHHDCNRSNGDQSNAHEDEV